MRATPITPTELIKKLHKIPNWLFRTLPEQLREKGPDRVLIHYLARFGIPDTLTRELFFYGRMTRHPVSLLRRRAKLQSEINIQPDQAWLKLPDGYADDVDQLVAHCDTIFQRDADFWRKNWQPPFSLLINFDTDETGRPRAERPDDVLPIVKFCAQPKIFYLVSEYLGQYPVLSSVTLAYTGINNEKVGSQQFHRDMGHDQVHMVVPIWPIDEETGPFTLLPACVSANIVKKINHTGGRVSDEAIFSHASRDDLVKLTGKPGEIYFANPLRCFHYGARSSGRPRLVLIVNFSSIFDLPSNVAAYRCSNRSLFSDGSQNARTLLNL